jgi:transposase-like protein
MLSYSAKHRGWVDKDETWKKIVELYSGGEVTIAQLAKRFDLTGQAIRNGLRQRKLLRERKHTKCGENVSTN